MSGWISPEQAGVLAARLGLGPVVAAPSASHSVWLCQQDAVVLRIAPSGTGRAVVAGQVRVAAALHRAGVPFTCPLPGRVPVRRVNGWWVSLWRAEQQVGPVDWHDFGRAVRALHERGGAAVMRARLRLPVGDDLAGLDRRVRVAAAAGHMSAGQADMLREAVAAAQDLPVPVDPDAARRVLTHEDLWVKNAVQTARGTVLLDPDGMCWGRPEHDLAFVSRAHGLGQASAGQVTAFEAGYGAAVPDLDRAQVLALPHRVRWTLWLVDRVIQDGPDRAAAARFLSQSWAEWEAAAAQRRAAQVTAV